MTGIVELLQRWRDEDQADALTLTRHEIITLLELLYEQRVVQLRPDIDAAVDDRSRRTGLPREAIVNAILTAAFTFEQEDLDRIMRRGQHDAATKQ